MTDDDCDFETLAALLDDDDDYDGGMQDPHMTSPHTIGDNHDDLDALTQEEEKQDEIKMLYAKIAELETRKKIKEQTKFEKTSPEATTSVCAMKEAPTGLFSEATPDVNPRRYKNDKLPSCYYSDSDSDWEDMEGDKPGDLSVSGREINTMLHKTSSSFKRIAHEEKFKRSETQAPVSKPVLENPTTPAAEPFADMKFAPTSSYSSQLMPSKRSGGVDEYYETEFFSNIRVKKPLVSSLTLKNLMTGRKFVSVPNITKTQRMGKMDGDWVTIGVIVGKSEVRKSPKGSLFCSWRLSSLASCEDPQVQCFLFGEAFKKHWKTPVGSVVGLLNPNPMSNKEGGRASDELSLMVEADRKVLQLGHSKDFALCRSKTKAGRDCSNFVNKQKGEFCIYHVQSKYNKQSAKRADLQSGYSGVTPKSFEKKVFKKSSTTFNYGGQTFTSEPSGSSTRNSKKAAAGIKLEDLQRQYQRTADNRQGISTLSMYDVKPEGKIIPDKKTSKKNEAFFERLMVPSPGSMQFVKHLKDQNMKEMKKQILENGPKKKNLHISARDFLKQHVVPMKKKKLLLDDVPRLGRGNSDGLVSLYEPSTSYHAPTISSATFNAIEKLKENGGIAKPDPNAVKGKRKVEETNVKEVQQRKPFNREEFAARLAKEFPPRKKARTLSDYNLDREEMKRLLNAKSAHDNMLSQEEAEKMDDYFEALEKTENMETALSAVTQIKCKAVTCRTCKYRTFGASQRCIKEGHRLIYYDAVKRFFACQGCGDRLVTPDRYPKETCRKCGSSSYKSASMMKERKVPKLASEELLLRGHEMKNLNTLY